MFNWWKRYSLLFAIILFLFISLFLLSRYGQYKGEPIFLEKTLRFLAYPLQKNVQRLVTWVKEIGESYFFLVGVQEENKILRREISELRQENARLQEIIFAEERLKKLYALHPKSGIIAQIIGRDPSSWFKSLLIDKGQLAGVKKDMVAIGPGGVVGRIIDVSAQTAKILLITDPNSAVDVLIQRSRAQGILEGNVEDYCILKYVPKAEDIQAGDTVLTSGIGGIFPKGLMIGTVRRVDKKRAGIFQYVEVSPAVDFAKLEELLIIHGEP